MNLDSKQSAALNRVQRAAHRQAEMTQELGEAIVEAHREGVPVTHIVQVTGRSRSTIHRWLTQQQPLQ